MVCLCDIPDRALSPVQEIYIKSYESLLETELRNLKAMSEILKICNCISTRINELNRKYMYKTSFFSSQKFMY